MYSTTAIIKFVLINIVLLFCLTDFVSKLGIVVRTEGAVCLVNRFIEQTGNSESVFLLRDGARVPYDEVRKSVEMNQ